MRDEPDAYLPEWMATHIAAISSAYLGQNKIPPDRIPGVMQRIKDGYLYAVRNDGAPAVNETQYAAVDPAESIHRDHLVCLDCGGKFKHLTTHIWTKHGLRPGDYRRKWRLPDDYPMSAPITRDKHRLKVASNTHFRSKS